MDSKVLSFLPPHPGAFAVVFGFLFCISNLMFHWSTLKVRSAKVQPAATAKIRHLRRLLSGMDGQPELDLESTNTRVE